MSRNRCSTSTIEVSTLSAIQAAIKELAYYEECQLNDKKGWAEKILDDIISSNKGFLRKYGILKKHIEPTIDEVVKALDTIYGCADCAEDERGRAVEVLVENRIGEWDDMVISMMYYDFAKGENITTIRRIAGLDPSKINLGIISKTIDLSIDDARLIGVI